MIYKKKIYLKKLFNIEVIFITKKAKINNKKFEIKKIYNQKN